MRRLKGLAVVVALGFITNPIECSAQSSSPGELLMEKALKLLRAAAECPPEPCDTHCGLSAGHTENKYLGTRETFKVTATEYLRMGTITGTIMANFRDLDGSRIETERESLRVSCRNGRECVQESQSIQCAPRYDCMEFLQRTNAPVPARSSKLEFQFCDEKNADNAKVAIETIFRVNAVSTFATNSGESSKSGSSKPTFNCSANTSAIERAICGDETLGDKDQSLNNLYQQLRQSLSGNERRDLIQTQRAWLQTRDQCHEPVVACVKRLYDSRIRELQNLSAKR
jgi:uncharacterized protein YecT (DUF1311 family)